MLRNLGPVLPRKFNTALGANVRGAQFNNGATADYRARQSASDAMLRNLDHMVPRKFNTVLGANIRLAPLINPRVCALWSKTIRE
jgi:hypothetical protein